MIGVERHNTHRVARRARLAALVSAVLLCGSSRAGTPDPVAAVPSVDLDRYSGTWFEVARFDNRFQRACAGDATTAYGLRQDGRIDVVNRCRRADGSLTDVHGIARVADPASRSKLKVRFAPAFLSWLPAVWADYWVIGLADDYTWAVVGTPDRKYLWILSRTPVLDEPSYERALGMVRGNGFDAGRLQRTRHTAPAGVFLNGSPGCSSGAGNGCRSA